MHTSHDEAEATAIIRQADTALGQQASLKRSRVMRRNLAVGSCLLCTGYSQTHAQCCCYPDLLAQSCSVPDPVIKEKPPVSGGFN